MGELEQLFDQPIQDDFNPEKRKKVGGYVLGRILGEGSFAKVRFGVHIVSKEKVAIKVINKKIVHKKDYIRMNMRREAAVLQRLDHPHIARLYEILETENSFYIVQELVDGEDMMEYLNKKNGVSESEARCYMRQIVSALDHMHRSGVVHRDLKVENLLRDNDSNIKIIDFGLSNFSSRESMMTTQCGSPAYSAPEVFSKQHYGPGVDVWTVGVDLYAMVTGSLPFNADPPNNLTKLHASILKGCHFPNYLSQGCRDLLRRMLEVSDTKRISVQELMVHPWLNADYIPLEPWDLKTKLCDEEIDDDIIKHMAATLSYKEEDIRENVINQRPTAAAATYHHLERKQSRKESRRLKKSEQIQMPAVAMDTDSPSGGMSYKECLRQLKETKRKNILKRCSISTPEAQSAIEKVAEVNRSTDETLEKEPSSTAVKRLGFTLKAKLDEENAQKKEHSPQISAAELRTLSNRFLQKYGITNRYATYKPQKAETSRRNPSHRLIDLMRRYSNTEVNTAPPAPPNSAHRNKADTLPKIVPKDDDSSTSEEVASHRCSTERPPVVRESTTAIPDSTGDHFYEGYRFKVRNSEGERMHTWDLRSLRPLGVSQPENQRSKTSLDIKVRKSALLPERTLQVRERTISDPGKMSYKDLGLSYSVPEHNASIPRSRQRKDMTSSADHSLSNRNSLLQTTSTPKHRSVTINSRDFMYSSLRSGRLPTFALKETMTAKTS